jgi:hypothetical protein
MAMVMVTGSETLILIAEAFLGTIRRCMVQMVSIGLLMLWRFDLSTEHGRMYF